MKIGYFHPYFYKGIVLKIRVRNTPIFSIYDTFAKKKFKNNDFQPYFYKGIVLKIGVQNGSF